MRMIKKLASYVGKYKFYMLLAPLLVVGETVAELIIPRLMANIIDKGVATGDIKYIATMGFYMVLCALAGIIVGVFSAKFSSIASQGYGSNLRVALFEKIQTFSFADVDRFSTASLITRITNDIKNLQQIVMMITRVLIRAPSLLIISLIICITLNAKLAMIYLIAIPLIFLSVYILIKLTHHLFRVMQEKFDGLNASVQENLIAIRVVKSFVRTSYEKEKFKISNEDLRDTQIFASMRLVLMNPITTFALNATTIAAFWFGGLLVGSNQMLTGELVSFISYLNNVLMSIMMFTMILTQIPRSKACADRVVEVLNHEPNIHDDHSKEAVTGGERLCGKIEFKDVSFKYPNDEAENYVLRNVSFTAFPGEFVAIVGSTGTGKTSLVNLIPRFYDADSGEVMIDDTDVKHYSLEHLRQNIGMVLQSNILFSGTIRENLQWGDLMAGDNELLEIAKRSQAYEFISQFPQGLDTIIDQGGVNVSGGQKQRLCIGRAMLKNPSILILDDSTSAVDSVTEAKIRETFYSDFKDTTVILIAQRISSVQYADKVIVLADDGTISAVGTHDELMASNSIYQAIYSSQQEGVKIVNA